MLTFKYLYPETWNYLQALFGEKGACGGCWCMYWRLPKKVYERNKGLKNREALSNLIQEGRPLGVLALNDDIPIGWCSVSPKTDLIRLQTSRLLKATEMHKSIWSITCLFIHKDYRQMGLSSKLISAASDHAFNNGASVVEAYPILQKKENMPAVFVWVGFVNSFEKAGFKKFTQVSENRQVMRLTK